MEQLRLNYFPRGRLRAAARVGASILLLLRSASSYHHRFLIVRHGETNYNANGRVQGTLESTLTDRGKAQASELGRWLAGAEPDIHRVFVSPKTRARETLEGIAAEHEGVRACGHTVRPGLREIELTGWEGQLRSDVIRTDGEQWSRWKAEPVGFRFSDGHAPFDDLWERAADEWDHLKLASTADPNEPSSSTTTLVVAHGALNRALVLRMLGLPVQGWKEDKEYFIFDNCECVELEWRRGGHHACRWRRRHPCEAPWETHDSVQERAQRLYSSAKSYSPSQPS